MPAPTFLFPSVLSLGVFLRLSLHVGRRVGPTALQWNDMIDNVTRAALGVLAEGTVHVEHVLIASLVVRRLSPLVGGVTTGVTTCPEEKINEINTVTTVTTVTTNFGGKSFGM
jgi:hypothetical protein